MGEETRAGRSALAIAGYELHTLDSGRFGLDGGAMFGIVPKPLWHRVAPADDRNRIDLATRLLLLRGHGRTILVDTGIGDKFADKERDIYKVDPRAGEVDRALDGALAERGVARADVTDVLLTHLHFDHAGGATRRAGDALVPGFPNATYHVQERNLAWARDPSDRDRASYLRPDFDPLAEAGVLETLDGGGEPFPGVHVEPVDGHTFGQQLVRIEGEGRTLLFCGDLVPTAAHVSIPWVMAYDLQPLVTVREKHDFFRRALEGEWILVLEHDPEVEAIRLGEGRRGVEVAERLELRDLA